MKKILILLAGLVIAGNVSAQKIRGGFGYHRPVPRVGVGVGFGVPLFYPYNPYYPYGPAFGYPYGYYRPYRESRLELQIQDIRNDYKDRIWSVKHDTSLTRTERKVKVHDLKVQREKEIIDAKRNYYKPDSRDLPKG